MGLGAAEVNVACLLKICAMVWVLPASSSLIDAPPPSITPQRGDIATFYRPAIYVDGLPVMTRENRIWNGAAWVPIDRPPDPPINKRQERFE